MEETLPDLARYPVSPLQRTETMTKKNEDTAANRAEKRISPDSPLGVNDGQGEEDFYQKQRDASPDGMTASERDQAQKAAPGALDQLAGGEKVGEKEDESNPKGLHKQQHP